MKSYPNLMMSGLIFILIASCSNLEQSHPHSQNILQESEENKLVHISDKASDPGINIPFNKEAAFYPMAKDGSGVEYKWRECVKEFIICFKWKQKKVIFRFDDKEKMQWFINNSFGLKKRDMP
jgi:hypothetical protein